MIPFWTLFKLGRKVAHHTGLIEQPSLNRPKKSAWIVLQTLRVLTVVVLSGIAVVEWCMILKDGIHEVFFVFQAITHVMVSFLAVALIVAESGLLSQYFFDNWPLLSESHGLTWLGFMMVVIGCKLLGNLTEPVNSQVLLGMPIWRAIIATGILCIVFGLLNMIASFFYKTPMYSAREVRRFGSKLDGMNSVREYDFAHSTHRAGPLGGLGNLEKVKDVPSWKRFSTVFSGTKKATNTAKNLKISKPIKVQGTHDIEANVDSASASSGSYATSNSDSRPDYISHSRSSPIVPGIVRPPTALHPVNRDETGAGYGPGNVI